MAQHPTIEDLEIEAEEEIRRTGAHLKYAKAYAFPKDGINHWIPVGRLELPSGKSYKSIHGYPLCPQCGGERCPACLNSGSLAYVQDRAYINALYEVLYVDCGLATMFDFEPRHPIVCLKKAEAEAEYNDPLR